MRGWPIWASTVYATCPAHNTQLSHPDLHNDFPPLRTSEPVASQHLSVQLTTFVGREAQMADVRDHKKA